ncbi:MAG: arylsulfatase [Clostridiales bacterium]|nr:arylsulfatase [Clostridiales bacterium]
MCKKPNIVLIMTDEMRGDCMGIAGHPDVKTPYIDTLASNGIYYPNAYSACPTCVPARAALHTGLTPRHTGRVGYRDRVDWNYGCTMAGELKKAGYYTQCVGKMHVHPLRNYLGFDNVELHDGYLHEYRYPNVAYGENQLVADDYFYWLKNEKGISADVTDTGLDCNGWVARPWIYDEMSHPTNWAVTRSIDFLRRRDPRQPFFLMTSFVRPHAPFDAPQYYFDLYKDKPLEPPVSGDWDDKELIREMGRCYNAPTGPLDKELLRQMRIGYYACITHVDHQIGRLIMALVEQRLMDNTVILFCSDHGEMLGDHSYIRKSLAYQGSVRIPMIISGPGHIIKRRNVTDDSLVELRDVMPTFLDLAGGKIPATLDGESMLNGISREYLHGEHIFEYKQKSMQYIVTKTDKYIWFSETGEEQYFNLAADPGETHNAVNDAGAKPRVEALRAALIKELEGREEGYSDGRSLTVGCTPVALLSNATEKNC